MIVIKCNALLNDEQRRAMEINIHDQAADGVIVLPSCCDLVHANLAEETVVIKYADGHAVLCGGCAYRNRMATISGTLPEKLICPQHTIGHEEMVFCPNWPPVE